ncbi:RnfABCDGE type electron transport complex subunit G [Tichowtungia aerotolerans]|uniref:Ion-translocating oxidoreductase complex subunit G n=1 Tax=Tichowtungia aerotolerans TaxID=2697043 RepID=A0A6P1MBQ6_9BACT|nr:RnfABCDGE type electron transport complex subunit G [Tichowtungia aerotolerans]QHI70533.1 RnfABCDGE type electron transport complex subunit G [Tichowtungia aerotolerans]
MNGNKVNIPVLATALALIAGVAAALLGWVYLLTQEPIAAALQAKTNTALGEVLPEFDNQPAEETIIKDGVTFYVGRKDGQVVGFAGETITPKGYNGNVTVLAGLKPDGTITTVLVTKQSETPGLGTVVCERKREKTISKIIKGVKETGLPPNAILDQYSGMQAAAGSTEWTVEKDGGNCDAITGATITSRAVCGAVYTIAETFAANRSELITQ